VSLPIEEFRADEERQADVETDCFSWCSWRPAVNRLFWALHEDFEDGGQALCSIPGARDSHAI
jgi:hypothetical protein